MEIEKQANKIFILEFDTRREMGETMIRFEEYYESPVFKNKIFTLGEYRKWYTEQYGAFTYYEDWNGFNIPSYILTPFEQGLFDPLTDKEKNILDIFKNTEHPYYIIAVSKEGESEDLTHELCHALFYTSEDYRQEVLSFLDENRPALDNIYKYVEDLGYHKSVWNDEVNAYLTADGDFLREKGVTVIKGLEIKVQDIYAKYINKKGVKHGRYRRS